MKRVMVFGTFDFFHAGHLSLFRQAKKYGDVLIVIVSRDKRATEVKGKAPIHSEKERVELVRNILRLSSTCQKWRFWAFQKHKPNRFIKTISLCRA